MTIIANNNSAYYHLLKASHTPGMKQFLWAIPAHSSQQTCEISTIIFPTSLMRKQRLIESLIDVSISGKWQNWDSHGIKKLIVTGLVLSAWH